MEQDFLDIERKIYPLQIFSLGMLVALLSAYIYIISSWVAARVVDPDLIFKSSWIRIRSTIIDLDPEPYF